MSANNFWVDPDALERHARPYEEAADGFDKLSRSLGELLARYPNAFGQDDLGQKFSDSFNKGVDGVKDRIDKVSQRMAYIGDGLKVNAVSFREAEDTAEEVSTKLNEHFQTNPNGPQKSSGPPEGDATQATAATLPSGTMVDSSKDADLHDDTLSARERTVPNGPMVGPADEGPAPGQVADRNFLTSTLFSPTTDDGVIQIDGVTVDKGLRLIGANEIGDGKVRLEVDGFESITPIGQDRSVMIDGLPMPVSDDQQWFLVKDAPEGSDSRPGKIVEFGRDGSAVAV